MSLINARLSDDVFIFIFEHVHDLRGRSPTAIDYAIVLSHVCRRWRRLAENTPLLWAKFWSGRSHADLIAKQLKQVGGLPVTIDWNIQGPRRQSSLAMLTTILQSKARVCDVSLTFCRADFTTVLQLLQHSPRHTTSLSLEGFCTDDCDQRHSGAQAPLDIISERQLWATLPTFTPALLSLTIEKLPWFAPGPSTWNFLKELTVEPTDGERSSQKLSIAEIHERLCGFPTLESLNVTEVVVDFDDMMLSVEDLLNSPGELVFPGNRLQLPNLRSLYLNLFSGLDTVQFCRSIAVQPDCKFCCSLYSDASDLPVPLLLKHIFPFGRTHRPAIRTFHYNVSGLELIFEGDAETYEGVHWTQIAVYCAMDDEDYAPFAVQAWSLYNFAHLRELTIRIDHPSGECYRLVWEDLFRMCSSVESLILQGFVIPAFIEHCHVRLELQTLEVLFPRVTTLRCLKIGAADWQSLHEALTGRLAAGFGPQQLQYTNDKVGTMVTVDLTPLYRPREFAS